MSTELGGRHDIWTILYVMIASFPDRKVTTALEERGVEEDWLGTIVLGRDVVTAVDDR